MELTHQPGGIPATARRGGRSMTIPLLVISLAAVVGGCAGLRVTPVDTSDTRWGFRYYEPSPH